MITIFLTAVIGLAIGMIAGVALLIYLLNNNPPTFPW